MNDTQISQKYINTNKSIYDKNYTYLNENKKDPKQNASNTLEIAVGAKSSEHIDFNKNVIVRCEKDDPKFNYFRIFRSVENLEKEIFDEKIPPGYHEVIQFWRTQKYFIDFDGEGIEEKLRSSIKEHVKEAINDSFEILIERSYFNTDEKYIDVITTDCSREEKMSVHFILTTIEFKNHAYIDKFHKIGDYSWLCINNKK